MSQLRIPSLRATSVSIVQSSASPEAASGDCCSICHRNAARYTCPRCSAPYCSVPCYQTHGTSAECTEAFYKHRVNSILELEVKEKATDMIGILERHERQELLDNSDRLAGSIGSATNASGLSRDELVQLLSLLEQHEDNDAAMTKALSQDSMQRFRSAVNQVMLDLKRGLDGDLHEWILEPWYPWWRTQLVNEHDDANLEGEEVASAQATLDERILAVPHFTTLMRRSHLLDTPPQLQFNLVDILYSTVYTLWLYHGATNAATELPMEAYAALVQGSAVLSSDARCSDLDEVLTRERRCFETPMNDKDETVPNCDAIWHDVAQLCHNHRLVARALLEMDDIVQAAVTTAKQQKATNKGEIRSVMRKVGKKLQFYLSWSLLYKTKVASMQRLILERIGRNTSTVPVYGR